MRDDREDEGATARDAGAVDVETGGERWMVTVRLSKVQVCP
jgi:hypothetical protein